MEGTGRPGQVWVWAARQAIAPAGNPSGVGVQRLQPTRLMVLVCRSSPFAQTRAASQLAIAQWNSHDDQARNGGRSTLPSALLLPVTQLLCCSR